MTSYPPLRNDDAEKAAKKYVHDYHKHAVRFLVDHCDPVQLLKDACRFENHNYHRIMAEDSEDEDDTKSHSSHLSQVSHRRTFSSHSRSGLSTVPSSWGSGDSSSNILWAMPDNTSKGVKTLTATNLAESDYLIQVDVVRKRLMLEPNRHSGGTMVHYSGGPIHSLGTVSFEWAWNPKDLRSKKSQRNTFHVVEVLPDSDVILGDSDSPDSPIRRKGTSPTLEGYISF
jgi:hypothetical protein